MSYSHLTIIERTKIETYMSLGYPLRKIALYLNRSPSTISRELRRHANYSAQEAHSRYQTNQSNCGAKTKLTPEIKQEIQKKLKDTWSPEQIIGRLYQGKLSYKSIYRWIDKGLLEVQAYFVKKENAKSLKKQEDDSILAHRFQNALKLFIKAKRLGIGNWIPLFQVVEKRKDVWRHS